MAISSPLLRQNISRILLSACLIFALSACSMLWSGGSDMVIVNPENGKVTPLPYSTFRQTIVQTDDDASQFTTITLDEKREFALLRRYDIQGNRLSETVIPKFLDGYAGGENHSLSPDGTKIIYKKLGDLRLLNLNAQPRQDSVVLSDAMHKYGRILVRWLTNDRILLVTELPDQDEKYSYLYRILLLDISTGKSAQLYRDAHLDHVGYSSHLSPDKTRLVIMDRGERLGLQQKLAVLDLNTGGVSHIISEGTNTYYGAVSWSPDSKALVFVEKTQKSNNESIQIWRASDHSFKPLLQVSDGRLIYGLIWAGETIGYYAGHSGGRHSDLTLLDASSGQEIRRVNIYVNGKLYYLPNSKRIIAETN